MVHPKVVDCPEFLVHFPTLVRLAEQHGLMMIGKQRFQNFFNAKKDAQDGRMLLSRMNALETFPSRCAIMLIVQPFAIVGKQWDQRSSMNTWLSSKKDKRCIIIMTKSCNYDEHVFCMKL